MNRIVLVLLAALVVPVIEPQEKLTLATPVSTTISEFTNDSIAIARTPLITITVELKSNVEGIRNITCVWGQMGNVKGGLTCTNGFQDPTAPSGYTDTRAMMAAINKGNFAAPNPSLNKFICLQLLADGAFTGSCS